MLRYLPENLGINSDCFQTRNQAAAGFCRVQQRKPGSGLRDRAFHLNGAMLSVFVLARRVLEKNDALNSMLATERVFKLGSLLTITSPGVVANIAYPAVAQGEASLPGSSALFLFSPASVRHAGNC
ncbi:hypothetical protein FJU08_16865 [Martelella alba]|uniref:Uncharacterized protein n=1 Tax=Martelella alba TaxID=2590451 RepID=A0A506U5X2_9HYPH|nr:hypothetical protein FJU08_16865 [Martelella alba]